MRAMIVDDRLQPVLSSGFCLRPAVSRKSLRRKFAGMLSRNSWSLALSYVQRPLCLRQMECNLQELLVRSPPQVCLLLHIVSIRTNLTGVNAVITDEAR